MKDVTDVEFKDVEPKDQFMDGFAYGLIVGIGMVSLVFLVGIGIIKLLGT